MKILDKVPHQLAGRGAQDSVPIGCACGGMFLWERGKGADVRCPDCKMVNHVDALEPKKDPA